MYILHDSSFFLHCLLQRDVKIIKITRVVQACILESVYGVEFRTTQNKRGVRQIRLKLVEKKNAPTFNAGYPVLLRTSSDSKEKTF